MPKKRVTDRKLAANRANARRSTGPRTPEGKARSARNAVRHGLLTRHIVPASHPIEDPAEFDALLADLTEQFTPQDRFEELCIERMTACYWRLARAIRFESQAIQEARAGDLEPMAVMGRELTGVRLDEDHHVLPKAPDLDRLIRYEYMIDREIQRTLNQLDRHRSDPPPMPAHTEPPPQPALPSPSPGSPSPDPASKRARPDFPNPSSADSDLKSNLPPSPADPPTAPIDQPTTINNHSRRNEPKLSSFSTASGGFLAQAIVKTNPPTTECSGRPPCRPLETTGIPRPAQ